MQRNRRSNELDQMYQVYFQMEDEYPCVFAAPDWHTVATVYQSLCFGVPLLHSWRVIKDEIEYNMTTAQPVAEVSNGLQ